MLDDEDPDELARLWETMKAGFSKRMDHAVLGLIEEAREYRRHECDEDERDGCRFVATQQHRLSVLMRPLTRKDLADVGLVDSWANPLTGILWGIYEFCQ